jgi:acyl-CoA reductase-like NAD-dependent aldehyde dehydrogenase
LSSVHPSTVEHTSHAIDFDLPEPLGVFVGGAWRKATGDRLIDVVDPTTEEVLVQVALPSVADADDAVAAAREAYDRGPWPRLAIEERVEVVRRFTRALEDRIEDLNVAWVLEAGPTLAHARATNNGAGMLTWNHALAIAPTLPWEENRGETVIRREPSGTVLAILTSNGPTVLIGLNVVPALLAGCPVIVKHSPESQLSAHIIAEAARLADFPEGVVSFLPAGIEVTQHLVSHEGIDVVTATGSQAIAVDIVARTAPRLARTILELGGKSPAILLEDVDLAGIVPDVAEGAQPFNGQVCVALSRILVPRSRYGETVQAFKEYFEGLTLGDPLDPASSRGPLSVARALDRVESFVTEAVEQGATVVCGGKRPEGIDRGYFYEPTVLSDVRPEMRVAREEVFGPVTVLIPYDDVDEAVDIANDSDYGLAASVYTNDAEAAMDIARRIRSGTVGVNIAGFSLEQPFGGVKKSGWGRECGAEGILEFTDIKQVLLPTGKSYLG